MTNGYEYYGTFMRALYTLFQVMSPPQLASLATCLHCTSL